MCRFFSFNILNYSVGVRAHSDDPNMIFIFFHTFVWFADQFVYVCLTESSEWVVFFRFCRHIDSFHIHFGWLIKQSQNFCFFSETAYTKTKFYTDASQIVRSIFCCCCWFSSAFDVHFSAFVFFFLACPNVFVVNMGQTKMFGSASGSAPTVRKSMSNFSQYFYI